LQLQELQTKKSRGLIRLILYSVLLFPRDLYRVRVSPESETVKPGTRCNILQAIGERFRLYWFEFQPVQIRAIVAAIAAGEIVGETIPAYVASGHDVPRVRLSRAPFRTAARFAFRAMRAACFRVIFPAKKSALILACFVACFMVYNSVLILAKLPVLIMPQLQLIANR